MPKEIERKFLIANDSWRGKARGEHIFQAYLGKGTHCVFRVRTRAERAWLTIKGKRTGICGDEFEYEIPLADARKLIESYAEAGIIEKVRYCIPAAGLADGPDAGRDAGLTWEIDEFLGDNQGLVMAEIELAHENQPFERPEWLGQEVSDDSRYTNFNLAQLPYAFWEK